MSKMQSDEKSFFKELTKIEDELKAIWKLLSLSEQQKWSVVHKMNRVQMTLHRLKFTHDTGIKTQASQEPTRDTDFVSQQILKRD